MNVNIMDKSYIKMLLVSVLSVCIITIGHYINNASVILVGLLLIMLNFLLNGVENSFYMLLFLIPSNNILRVGYDSRTLLAFLSVEFLLLLLWESYKKNKKINIILIVCIFLVSSLSMVSFIVKNNLNNIIEFIGNIISFVNFALLTEFSKEICFKKGMVAYIIGVVCSGFSGSILRSLPHMLIFFSNDAIVSQWGKINRFSGLDSDSNYFSFYILYGVALMMASKKQIEGKINMIFYYILILFLTIIGLFSYSRTYLFVLVVIIGIHMLYTLRYNYNFSLDKIFLFGVVIGLGYLLLSRTINKYFIAPYLIRMNYALETGDLSNGRAILAFTYLQRIVDDIFILFFGVGFARDEMLLFRATHNTYITLIYSYGIVGSIMLIYFYLLAVRYMNNNLSPKIPIAKNKICPIITQYYPLIVLLLYMLFLDFIYVRIFQYILYFSFLSILKFPNAKKEMYYSSQFRERNSLHCKIINYVERHHIIGLLKDNEIARKGEKDR